MGLTSNHYDNWPTQFSHFTSPYTNPFVDTKPQLGDLLKLRNALKPIIDVAPKFELKNGNYELAAFMSGHAKADVKVSISENKLTVKAENGGLDGKASTSFTTAVPTKANAGAITVSLVDGILRITMSEITPTVINIQIP